jgi:hypothetical protein
MRLLVLVVVCGLGGGCARALSSSRRSTRSFPTSACGSRATSIYDGRVRVLALLSCSGCVLGGGGAIGYGTKRGTYVGGTATAGVTAGQLTLELGATGEGPGGQLRLEADVSKARIEWSDIDDDLYPGGRAGIGYAVSANEESVTAIAGPNLAFLVSDSRCKHSLISLGLEYRWVGGESQIVFTPRYETVFGLCLD